MKMIDGHIHLDTNAAENAKAVCSQNGSDMYSVLSLSQYRDDPLQNLACLYAKALNPDHVYAFAGLNHPHSGEREADYLAQARLWLDAGFDGMKLIETKPDCAKRLGVSLDDMRFDPLFDMLERCQIPVLWHVGDPAEFWDIKRVPDWAIQRGWAYLDGTYPALETLYAQTERVLRRHPNLKAAFAHFYFTSDDLSHARQILAEYKNLYFDLTPGREMYFNFSSSVETWRAFFLQHAQRLLYGTDTKVDCAGTCDPSTALSVRGFLMQDGLSSLWGKNARGLGLPYDVLECLMCKNYQNFAGMGPRLLSRNGIGAACDYTLDFIGSRNDSEKLAAAKALVKKILARL